MKKTDLIKAANELNDLFFEEKDPQRIDTTKSEAKIKSGISEACEMFEEGDKDNLSKSTLKVLEDLIDDGIYSDEALHVMENVLGITVPDSDDADEDNESENTGVDNESDDDNEAEETQPEEVEPEDSPDLQEIINTTKKLIDLKQVVLDNEEFADLEDDLEDYKGFQGLKELRSDMQDLLEEDASSEEKPVKREKVIPESDSKPEKKETKKAGRLKSEKSEDKKKVSKKKKLSRPEVMANVLYASRKNPMTIDEMAKMMVDQFGGSFDQSKERTIMIQIRYLRALGLLEENNGKIKYIG